MASNWTNTLTLISDKTTWGLLIELRLKKGEGGPIEPDR